MNSTLTSSYTPTVSFVSQDIQAVRSFLLALQENICNQLEAQEQDTSSDTAVAFLIDDWVRDAAGSDKQGGGRSCVLTGGTVIEKAGVMFSHIHIDKMPASATNRYPELAGRKAQAMGLSIVIHPTNPFVPTSHANVRLFVAEKAGELPIWWFGGGFDLTPFYPFTEDCEHWHNVAFDVCEPFGHEVYPKLKKMCDEYFYIAHRNEQRGIGGLFYDDFNEESMGWNFHKCFDFMKAVGNGYVSAIMPIIDKRKNEVFTQQQRNFQLYRRGRYTEFNLVYDRGTLFGLQSNGRIESILVSMPPLASWEYCYTAEKDSLEEKLIAHFLKPQDWCTR